MNDLPTQIHNAHAPVGWIIAFFLIAAAVGLVVMFVRHGRDQ